MQFASRSAPRTAGVLLALALLAGCAASGSPRFRTLAEIRAQQQADSLRRAEVALARSGPRAGPVQTLPPADSIPPAELAAAAPAAAPDDAAPDHVRPSPQASVRQGKWIHPGPNPPRIDLPLFDAPVADVATYIAERVGVDIVVSSDPEVRGTRLTGEIRNRYWHEALESILEAHGLRAMQAPSGIITIVSAREANRGRRPELVTLQYRDARDVVAALQPMFQADSVAPGSVDVLGDPLLSRTLVVYGSADQVAAVRQLVAEYDQRAANVSVEAWMLLVNRSAMDRRGVSYSFVPTFNDSTGGQTTAVQVGGSGAGSIPGLSGQALTLRGRLGGTPVGLNVFIDAMTAAGFAETETRPLVMTSSEREGKITVGDSYILPNPQPILAGAGVIVPGSPSGSAPEQPGPGYPAGAGGAGHGAVTGGGFAQFLTGTELRVTPIVLDGGRQVRMKVDLVRDGGTLSPDGRSITGGRHSTTTEVIVDDRTPIVIGSFTVQGTSKASSRVPLLGSLPLLGRLFSRDEVSSNYMDLVIVLVPHVHDRPLGVR